MAINKERLALGLEALEGGQFPQGMGTLKSNAEDGFLYCCLGVLCEVAKANGCEVTESPDYEGYGYFAFDGNTSTLPTSVMDWYGFEQSDPYLGKPDPLGNSCINANDVKGWSFLQIAQALRESYIDETTREVPDAENPQATPADLPAVG